MSDPVDYNVFQGDTTSEPIFIIKPDPTKPVVTIQEEDGHVTVSIFRDGHVEFGEGVDPEVAAEPAAKIFWDAVQATTPY